ncbi:sodium:solute symporter family protein [Micromonospora sp. DR5-3]|uniref:sodium:solute symporter family protein n=1 Tax=unclassified Micromonospora TaxID=2617518 RepID=UPI0011D4A55F|nr:MULTISPECIES: sodium:solute symporter family protein [unclassified Micromonospora]MCW3819750.1 sodium:solute symporter family protein [Micromonospora sp. DR5-3]TYC23327.1 sodium:solute symporter family protein [Micromonospora sp. MP36]
MTLAIVLVILLGTAAGAIGYGRRASRRTNVAEWAVGGRRLGTLLFWFINAGEVYTTFAVLGISGYAWALGAPAYLAFCSVSLSYAIGYWLMPKIWRAGRKHGLITQGDFFAARFGAPWLGVVAGLVGIAALVVYVQIQLVSLSLIVQLALGRTLSTTAAVIIAAVVMLAFVYLAGLRSAAFAAAVKDILMVLVVVLLSATVAAKVGAASMFDVFRLAEQAHPGIGKLPGIDPASPTGPVWLMTSALNVALGNWVFPHLFQVSYAAKSGRAIRRNAIWQPLYSLAYFFIILLGFAALVAGTQPADGNLNAALLQFVTDRYPAWVIGLVAGTGFLLALAPGSVLLLTSGSVFTRNVVAPLRRNLDERQALLLSRVSMIAFAAIAVWLTLGRSDSLVDILLYAYSAIGMLAPAVFLAFLWRRVTAIGVLAGITVGFVALLAPFAKTFWASHLPDWEPGLIAMAINLVVTVLVSLITPRPADEAVAVGHALRAEDVAAHGPAQPATIRS